MLQSFPRAAGHPAGDGADVEARNSANWSALHFAAQSGNLGVLEVLLEAGASADSVADPAEIFRFRPSRSSESICLGIGIRPVPTTPGSTPAAAASAIKSPVSVLNMSKLNPLGFPDPLPVY